MNYFRETLAILLLGFIQVIVEPLQEAPSFLAQFSVQVELFVYLEVWQGEMERKGEPGLGLVVLDNHQLRERGRIHLVVN